MQNKPNFRNAQMNISTVTTRNYENETTLMLQKNKPNQTQFQKSKNERKFCLHKGLQKKRCFRGPKKQTQFKPNLLKDKNECNPLCHKGL